MLLIFIESERAGVIHGLDFVWCFVLETGFLGQCLSIDLSTILRKTLNHELGFSADSVSPSLQLP